MVQIPWRRRTRVEFRSAIMKMGRIHERYVEPCCGANVRPLVGTWVMPNHITLLRAFMRIAVFVPFVCPAIDSTVISADTLLYGELYTTAGPHLHGAGRSDAAADPDATQAQGRRVDHRAGEAVADARGCGMAAALRTILVGQPRPAYIPCRAQGSRSANLVSRSFDLDRGSRSEHRPPASLY
jgi:hypothetical protein